MQAVSVAFNKLIENSDRASYEKKKASVLLSARSRSPFFLADFIAKQRLLSLAVYNLILCFFGGGMLHEVFFLEGYKNTAIYVTVF